MLKRPVDVLPSEPDILDRARAYASTGHPNLAKVYRFDPKRREVWLERPVTLANTTLTDAMRAALAEALTALHEQGSYHGAVHAGHVGWRGEEPILSFPREARVSTLAEDLKGLDDL